MTEDALAVRCEPLEGELVDVELEATVERYGWEAGIRLLLHRRHDRWLMDQFVDAGLPPGINGPVIDLEPLG